MMDSERKQTHRRESVIKKLESEKKTIVGEKLPRRAHSPEEVVPITTPRPSLPVEVLLMQRMEKRASERARTFIQIIHSLTNQ